MTAMDGPMIDQRERNVPVASPRTDRRLKVLLIAESCNPKMISVPLVGFSEAQALAKIADTHVVTHWRNGEDLTSVGWREGREFSTVDAEKPAKIAWWLGEKIAGRGKGWTLQTALFVPTYYYFEHLVWKAFGARLAAGEFDIVHRLTPLSPTAPSTLAARCKRIGVPFILGPLNGGVPWPRQFDSARRKEKEWLSYVRGAYQLMPAYRSTRGAAAAILVASRDTLKQMPPQYRRRCFYLPENAIDPNRFTLRRMHQAKRPIRVVFLGRLVPYKGADMLIEAVAPLAKEGSLVLDVIGDGPMMGELKELLVSLGSPENINLRGWVEHGKVQEWLAQADVFAFPSVREFGGAVALEAMAVGTVPIVLDYGGPAELVTEKTGFLVPMGNRQHIIQNFRTILADLALHPEKIEEKSQAALRRAREQFTWDSKARQTLEIYKWVLDPTLPRPSFPMPVPDL
jgi:glycosyltransferase involved in cell wall biosynthesis